MRQAKHGLSATRARTCRAGDAAALRTRLMACVWISGLGEIGASLLWRLYDDQFFNVPLFVPPGHALLYLWGDGARTMAPTNSFRPGTVDRRALRDSSRGLRYRYPEPVAICALCVVHALRARQLYTTMFVLALAMEIIGTSTGNWHWPAEVRYAALTTLNPPLAAGVFYCVLDWLAGLRARAARAAQWRTRPPL